MKNNLKLPVTLFFLGMIGVLSLLTGDVLAALSEEQRALALQQFNASTLQIIALASPTTLLIIAVVIGSLTYRKTNLSVPFIERLLEGNLEKSVFVQQAKYGLAGGLIAGIALVILSAMYYPYLPQSFILLEEKLSPTIWVRFFYGGITEEILLRFGVMSLLCWLGSLIVRNDYPLVRWIAIIISAIIFGLGHLPIVFSMTEPSPILIQYIIFGNALGGLVFGWLYWKKGLETSIYAHMITHVMLIAFQ